jgi:folate-binding Fe-S cluster repair protein YgfZ
MNSNWLDTLRSAGFSNDMESAGNRDADVRAAAAETVIAPLSHLSLIAASGDDAATFLHNLLSNDVNAIAPDGVRRAGFCTPKGRMLADFLIWRSRDGLVLQLSADLLPPILKKLSMYVLRSKVKLADMAQTHVLIGLSGPQATALLTQLNIPLVATAQSAHFADGMVIGLDAQRFELMVDIVRAADLWAQLAATARPVGLAAWRWLDISAGMPLITAATSEQFVPQMINYELIGGVGFKKGCYPARRSSPAPSTSARSSGACTVCTPMQ